eukprot:CAMPEP_0196997464 /NCGR_PEP_ID=MMETSP1380-20130617/3071_1 /TAXON_ID=5936 /ORGANISM="Euplotes crassus, Strain CT5" /LENGTH=65 /DNA_ID=CAMNT_0042413703 /DNA_START=13 /DNA_END=207 /DNA_ORIENTATION=+
MNKRSTKFICALYKIIQMFGDTNSIQNGPVSQSSEDTADSVEGTSMDETKASTYHDYNDRKVYEG